MADVFDVANWFLSKASMTPKKLQKLCYYFKAWGLALTDEDLLPGVEFQAWIHGPVHLPLYAKYRDYYWNFIPKSEDNSDKFSERELDLLNSVWDTYGELSANELEAQTHLEAPWRKARGDIDEFEKCTTTIDNEDMKNYYRERYNRNQGE